MLKRILLAGIGGGLALIVWSVVCNGLFGFRSRIELNRVPREEQVYAVLKETITEPGAYVCNPAVIPGAGYPPEEPVFSIRYSGMGHGAAGRLAFRDLGVAFLAPMIAAWLLCLAGERSLPGYRGRVIFFMGLGLLLAVSGELPKLGIGGYPVGSVLLLSAYDLVSWTLCGLVVAALLGGSGRDLREPATG